MKKKNKKLEKVCEAIANRNNKMETKGILHFQLKTADHLNLI